jgi:hypothetical protein
MHHQVHHSGTSIMKAILDAIARLSQITGREAVLEHDTAPSYSEIITDFLSSLAHDADTVPAIDQTTHAYRRRAMTANYSR